MACGADDAISIYRRTDDFDAGGPPPTPPTPPPSPDLLLARSYSEVGCYADFDSPEGQRIMTRKASELEMSADVGSIVGGTGGAVVQG